MRDTSVGYFDIETHAWDTFVVGATLGPGDSEPVPHWHDAGALLDAMAERPGVEWRAHYSGRFDTLLLLTVAVERGWSVAATMRGAGVLVARLRAPGDKRARVTLADTHALAPVGLRKLAASAGGVLKGEVDFAEVTPGLRPGSPAGRRVWEYLRRDVLALRDGDTAWRAVLREVAGVEPGRTLGGTAWRSALRHLAACGEDVTEPLDRHDYEDGRAGYFGGRVEVLRERAPTLWRYDRNSSYPAALTLQPVPVGRRRWIRDWRGELGTVWARVRVPEQRHPPLPLRFSSRVLYPTGVFDGVWTSVELSAALATGAARLVRVYRARVADASSLALREWCLHVWNARQSRPAWNGLLKLFANSLTGKLAQRDERSSVSYGPVESCPADAEPLCAPRDGRLWWRTSTRHVAPCARPEWAAMLTSEARVELRAQLEAADTASIYCDTDSVYAAVTLSRRVGTELGEWKFEGGGHDWHARAPKLYAYTDERGERKVRSKGLRGLTPEGFERLGFRDAEGYSPAVSSEDGVLSLLSSLRIADALEFSRALLSRRVLADPLWIGGRLRTRDGGTLAPTWEAARRRWGAPQ